MSIQELIDQALAQKEKRVRSGKFSPSSFGQCYRRQFFNRADVAPSNPLDERTLRVFKAGNLFHDFVQGVIAKDRADIQTEVLIETDDIKGYADLILDGEVTDIKSQNSRKFWYNCSEMKAGKDIKDMFYPNWLQVMWYCWQLNKERARLVFVSKDDLVIQEYSLPLDDYWRGELDMELTKLRYYWNGNTLPPVAPRLYQDKEGNYKECQYCLWQDFCIKTGKEAVNNWKNLAGGV